MKILSIAAILFITLFSFYTDDSSSLKEGALTFVSLNTSTESFTIEVLAEIPPNTTIHFTDSEWNGNRFGLDESDIIWSTGKESIKKGTLVVFKHLDFDASASIGTVQNKMRLSKKKEAIFAYRGSTRMPIKFLAAAANDSLAFGSLINTGLNANTSTVFSKKKN